MIIVLLLILFGITMNAGEKGSLKLKNKNKHKSKLSTSVPNIIDARRDLNEFVEENLPKQLVRRKKKSVLYKHAKIVREFLELLDDNKELEANGPWKSTVYIVAGTVATLLLIAVCIVALQMAKTNKQDVFTDMQQYYTCGTTGANTVMQSNMNTLLHQHNNII